MATVLLSFGVGAATAAFTLVNDLAPHAAPYVACETMLQLSSGPPHEVVSDTISVVTSRFARESADIPSADVIQERVAESYRAAYESSYQARYEAAGKAAGAWSSMTDDLDGRPLAPLFAAGALAMLVACARGASRMLAAPHSPAVAAVSAIGALLVSAMLIDVLGLPAMGLRAAAFAICVSMLAVRFARTARIDMMIAAA